MRISSHHALCMLLRLLAASTSLTRPSMIMSALAQQPADNMRREDPALRDSAGQDLTESFLIYHPPLQAHAPLPVLDLPTPLGTSKPRGMVHRDGDWHRSVHVWLASSSMLLMQMRSDKKDTFPSRWDVSCAGHMSGNDGSLETAVRELEEELGLSIDEAAMASAFVCTIPAEAVGETASHGRFLCREYQDLYVLPLSAVLGVPAASGSLTVALEQLTLGAGEVAGVSLRDVNEIFAAWDADDEAYVPRPPHYRRAMMTALRGMS